MASLHVGDTRAAETVLDEADVQALRERVRGAVIRPTDDGYDDARKIWNGMIDRRPGVIVRCAGVADVIDAVNFAREHELLLAVRGGSHSAAGHAMCDGGLVIDLCGLKGVRVDTRRADGRTRRAACSGTSSITRPRRSASPRPAGPSPTPASAA